MLPIPLTHSTTDRIVFLDVLRGAAVLVICWANSLSFEGYYAQTAAELAALSAPKLNAALYLATDVLVAGKWYSVFSILFGVGFALQAAKLRARGRSVGRFFTRRMLGLALIGGVHLFGFWYGDILLLYALLGLLLPLFVSCRDRTLLVWAGVLLLFPVAQRYLMQVSGFDFDALLVELDHYLTDRQMSPLYINGWPDFAAFFRQYLRLTDWEELLRTNWGMWRLRLSSLLYQGRFFKVLACFLLGLWAGRQIIHHELLDNRALLQNIWRYGLLVGLPLNGLLAFANTQASPTWQLVGALAYAGGVVPLAGAYTAGLALWWRRAPDSLRWLAPVGRLALTNYLLQTILSINIYYGVGLDLAFQVPLWGVLLITLGLIALQVAFSMLWLYFSRFGPVERMWRWWTYGV